MKKTTIKQLSQELDFTTDFEMYEYFITCYVNGILPLAGDYLVS